MSKTKRSDICALLTLLLLVTLPLGVLAQGNSQPAELTTSTSASSANVYANDSLPNDESAEVAENNFAALPDAPVPTGQTMKATPPPPQVKQVTSQVKYEARHWHLGGRIGAGFSPELFMFGLQSQIGPIFTRRLVFRPNADFSFGELTDMFALNVEGAYALRERIYGRWTPYFGVGPSLNFIHRGTSASNVSFSDFTYKTGFNVFVGAQKGRTFVEMRTALWSAPAPVLRLVLGYNF